LRNFLISGHGRQQLPDEVIRRLETMVARWLAREREVGFWKARSTAANPSEKKLNRIAKKSVVNPDAVPADA